MENNLTHHGIKGMRWGIRRFQNKDGSLTTAGKKRKTPHSDYENAHTKKSVKEMSDAELRSRNNRLQMENQYSQLKWQQNVIAKGAAYATTAVAVYGTIKSVQKNSGEIISAGKKFIEKLSH